MDKINMNIQTHPRSIIVKLLEAQSMIRDIERDYRISLGYLKTKIAEIVHDAQKISVDKYSSSGVEDSAKGSTYVTPRIIPVSEHIPNKPFRT